VWLKATFHRSLGHRPRITSLRNTIGRRPYSQTSLYDVNMAFGQKGLVFPTSWGDAPGYGEKWPSAKSAAVQKCATSKSVSDGLQRIVAPRFVASTDRFTWLMVKPPHSSLATLASLPDFAGINIQARQPAGFSIDPRVDANGMTNRQRPAILLSCVTTNHRLPRNMRWRIEPLLPVDLRIWLIIKWHVVMRVGVHKKWLSVT
jgi:hypothetical protein